jgi:recombination protein RecR
MKHVLDKFNRLVEALETLPTIGHKSALRLAYHMVMHDSFSAIKIAHAIENAIGSIKKCTRCGGMSEDELCYICADTHRNSKVLCIVEHARDILMFEENGLFDGYYFVLEALDSLDVAHLKARVAQGIEEVIFAMTPSVSNDAVILFIEDKLQDLNVNFTRIAQGVPTGVSLENIDMLSLTRALQDRVKV